MTHSGETRETADHHDDSDQELELLRTQIRQLDEELVGLAADRVRLARRIGEIKRAAGRPVVDYAQERRVLESAGERAARHGLAPRVAEDLMAGLIRAAVSAQEAENLKHAATGRGKRAVVVGGAGRMGAWMVRFLEAQGWDTAVVDPAAPDEESRRGRDWLPRAELVVCSTPPEATRELYESWCAAPPAGVVVDLASIKSPLVDAIAALRRAGGRVASLHPMFGPATALLRGKEVVVCDTGDEEASRFVEALFEPTTARLLRLPLETHDRVMADVLSLAHATVIAFTLALPHDKPLVHSNTYRALETLAGNAVDQNPDVYFQIQALNPYSLESLERLRDGVGKVLDVVRTHRPDRFAALLEAGRRRLLEGRPDAGA